MNRIQRRTIKAASLVLSVALGVAAVPYAHAQDGDDRETKQTLAMSQKVYEALTEIQGFVEAKQYTQAETAIRVLLQDEKLEPYERAQTWNLSAYSYYLQEKYQDAINSYNQVLAQPGLPAAVQQSALKTKAQLQFTTDDYQGALETVNQLMAVVPEPSADIFLLQGQAYFQLGDYQKALGPIKRGVDMKRAQGTVPKENELLLLRVIYYELKDYQNMIAILEELIAHYPKDTYLLTLAGAHSELGDTMKQLVIVEALYEKGYITSQAHIINLANLYLLHEAPYKAATVLEKELDAGTVPSNERNLRLLSQSWFTAREDEKSIPPLRQAAEIANDGELYVRLAQAYLNLSDWDNAASALQRGIQMGGLPRTDTANIMLGMALFNQKKFSQARNAFEAAARDDRSRRTAQQWINYVDSELKRAELMNQELPQTKPDVLNEMLEDAQ
ncbi:tetratricopeptide repeat protein [Marinihelvus fidelis]|uniref:Tetratricopeptide repeat protein n=1 Tax=Marinihelvus fidelis TaxID=2613842 RepID=A0A5N0TAU4_9GAMM|nr:tetratricopeptide repeat protein [Marinihelvus fidelis]KAA9130469.1 tetratricopeptide repeat protein [Marinihelvus fidelis]